MWVLHVSTGCDVTEAVSYLKKLVFWGTRISRYHWQIVLIFCSISHMKIHAFSELFSTDFDLLYKIIIIIKNIRIKGKITLIFTETNWRKAYEYIFFNSMFHCHIILFTPPPSNQNNAYKNKYLNLLIHEIVYLPVSCHIN